MSDDTLGSIEDNKIVLSKNQIWKCRNQYADSLGKSIDSKEDYFVMINSGPYSDGEDEFVRVNLISTTTGLRSVKDIFIENEDYIGQPFIIETWNEQPVLTSVLDEMVGKIDILPQTSSKNEKLTEKQKAFKKKELRRAAFLYQSILSNIAFHEQKPVKKIQLSSNSWILSIAASIIGLGLFIIQPGKLSNDEVFAENANPFRNTIAIEYSDQDLVRGSECILVEFTGDECQIIQVALNNYDEHNYLNTADLLNSIADLNERNEDIFFIYAVSQLLSDQPNEAINSLNILIDQNSPKYASDALYYLALSYIKNNEVLKARKVLRQLKNEDPAYLDDSSNLLKELRWF